MYIQCNTWQPYLSRSGLEPANKTERVRVVFAIQGNKMDFKQVRCKLSFRGGRNYNLAISMFSWLLILSGRTAMAVLSQDDIGVILGDHNTFRSSVVPSASNMVALVSIITYIERSKIIMLCYPWMSKSFALS